MLRLIFLFAMSIAVVMALSGDACSQNSEDQQGKSATETTVQNPESKTSETKQKADVKIDPKTGREIDPKTGKPKPWTISEIMQEAHGKNSLAKKVAIGKAKPDEAKRLHKLYAEMSKLKAPMGDAKSWASKNSDLLAAAKMAVDGKPNAGKQLQKATNCKACHSLHKPKKIVPENWQQKAKTGMSPDGKGETTPATKKPNSTPDK